MGTLKGMLDLARKKPYVHGDTPERLDLLNRADRFFGKYAWLDKDKVGLFREEMDRVGHTLHGTDARDIDWSVVKDGHRRKGSYERSLQSRHRHSRRE